MSTITAILEPNEDGTVHLPLPPELRNKRVNVTAIVRPASGNSEKPGAEKTRAALQRLRQLGTFRDISDPVAWQRSVRDDRTLPRRS